MTAKRQRQQTKDEFCFEWMIKTVAKMMTISAQRDQDNLMRQKAKRLLAVLLNVKESGDHLIGDGVKLKFDESNYPMQYLRAGSWRCLKERREFENRLDNIRTSKRATVIEDLNNYLFLPDIAEIYLQIDQLLQNENLNINENQNSEFAVLVRKIESTRYIYSRLGDKEADFDKAALEAVLDLIYFLFDRYLYGTWASNIFNNVVPSKKIQADYSGVFNVFADISDGLDFSLFSRESLLIILPMIEIGAVYISDGKVKASPIYTCGENSLMKSSLLRLLFYNAVEEYGNIEGYCKLEPLIPQLKILPLWVIDDIDLIKWSRFLMDNYSRFILKGDSYWIREQLRDLKRELMRQPNNCKSEVTEKINAFIRGGNYR